MLVNILKLHFAVFISLLLACSPGTETASSTETASEPDNEFAGKRIVHLLDEPRHRTVHQEGDLYLLDVQVNPGDISFPHTHDSAILLTRISNAEGPSRGEVSSNTDYATEPFTHEVSNDGPGLLRILAFTNLGQGVDDYSDNLPDGLSEPLIANRWFRSYRLTLQPGFTTAVLSHQHPAVIIQATDGIVYVQRQNSITTELNARGKWDWRGAGSAYALHNPGDSEVDVVINEGLL